MVTQRLRKVGNSLVLTVPKNEVDRLGLKDGDYVTAEFNKMELRPVLDPELKENLERNREALTEVMRYLKDK